MGAFPRPGRVAVQGSFISNSPSPGPAPFIAPVGDPAGFVRLPLVAVDSPRGVAGPLVVPNATVVFRPDTADCVTVNTKFVVPLLPSGSVRLPIDSVGGASSFWIVPVPVASTIVAF